MSGVLTLLGQHDGLGIVEGRDGRDDARHRAEGAENPEVSRREQATDNRGQCEAHRLSDRRPSHHDEHVPDEGRVLQPANEKGRLHEP